MKTKQEQIKEIMETLLAHQPIIDVPYDKINDIAIALVKEGYGDVKQAQIDVLNKLRRRSWQGYQIGMYIVSTQEIDELIKEVENENGTRANRSSDNGYSARGVPILQQRSL